VQYYWWRIEETVSRTPDNEMASGKLPLKQTHKSPSSLIDVFVNSINQDTLKVTPIVLNSKGHLAARKQQDHVR
jgi:hypothetical protein